MANYASTVLLEARALMTEENNKKFELRPNMTNIVGAFMKYTDQAIINLKQLKQATTQSTVLKYIKNVALTPGSSKSCTPSGTSGDSGTLTPSWLLKNFVAKVAAKPHDNNMISMAEALRTNLLNKEFQFWFGASGIDAALAALLNTNRTQVNAISATGVGHNTWDAVNYIVQVAKADVNRFYNYMKAEMMTNNYGGSLQEIHNTIWTSDRAYYMNQGGANSSNTGFQFDGVETTASNLLVPDTYYMSKHFIVPTGSLGFVTWNEMLNREGKTVGEKTWGLYESQVFPGVLFDMFAYETCEDTTSIGGAPQDAVVNIELSLNYYPFIMPLSNTNETPIFKYGVLST